MAVKTWFYLPVLLMISVCWLFVGCFYYQSRVLIVISISEQ